MQCSASPTRTTLACVSCRVLLRSNGVARARGISRYFTCTEALVNAYSALTFQTRCRLRRLTCPQMTQVADSPVALSVAAGPVDAARCSARFGLELEELDTTGYMVVAGEYVEVIVQPHDAFGNVTGWVDSLAFHVTADGPDTLSLPQVLPASRILRWGEGQG